eukprot:CFRG2812T1
MSCIALITSAAHVRKNSQKYLTMERNTNLVEQAEFLTNISRQSSLQWLKILIIMIVFGLYISVSVLADFPEFSSQRYYTTEQYEHDYSVKFLDRQARSTYKTNIKPHGEEGIIDQVFQRNQRQANPRRRVVQRGDPESKRQPFNEKSFQEIGKLDDLGDWDDKANQY